MTTSTVYLATWNAAPAERDRLLADHWSAEAPSSTRSPRSPAATASPR